MKEYRTIDLFAGIGGIRLGFESYGCKNVFTSEWDKDAQAMYQANFGEMPHGDITQINPADIPDHDILLAGFPCQPFSIIGKLNGFTDVRGSLFLNIEDILKVKKPTAFLLENVKNLKSHDGGRTFSIILEKLKNLNYHVHHTVLNALDFGLPQKRERTFIVGFKKNLNFSFPKYKTHYDLNNILEPNENLNPKLFASERILNNRMSKVEEIEMITPSIWHENKSGNISILPYSCALRAGGSHNYLLVNGVRRPSEREMLRLQGYPDTFKIVGSYSIIRKLTGNSVAVPVIKAIAKEMLLSLDGE